MNTLFDPGPPQRARRNPPEPTVAEYSSICPLCSKYIRANLSPVLSLPTAILPRCTPDGRRSLDDGLLYNSDGKPIRYKPRRWCHRKCWPKYFTEPRYETIEIPSRFGDYYRLIDQRDQTAHYLYRMFSVSGTLLYVGITYNLEERLRQHEITKPTHEVHRITTQKFETRSEVIAAEHEAIRFEKPLWNIAP